MEFILLIAISLIPAIIALSLPFYSRDSMTYALSLFLLFLCMWQVDIAFLYARDFFSVSVIDPLFRAFRFGSIMIMPTMYFFGYDLVKRHAELARYRRVFNRTGLIAVITFSTGVYALNFTPLGVTGYSVVQATLYAPSHMIPTYGSLNFAFLINILLVFIWTFILFAATIRLKNANVKAFYHKLIIGALLVFFNGVFSGFLALPLYFSSFNSILVAILLYLAFFQMQTGRLNRANDRLTEQSSLLKTVMDMSPNYLIVLDKEQRIMKLNNSICSLLRIEKENEIGRPFTEFLVRHSIDPEKETLQRIAKTYSHTRYIKWGFKELEVRNDELYTLFFGVDFTDQKENEELLVASEKSKVVGELAASIAHEIRNPLTTVRGFIQLLQERTNGPHEQLILDEIDRVDDVLKELLLLAKPEATNDVIHEEPTLVNALQEAQNVKLLFDSIAHEQNKKIHVSSDLEHVEARMKTSHFKQVLINILKNSLEALEPEGQVKIKLDERCGYLRLRIVDNGKGIAKDRLTRIGEPYYTNKEKGTGIGLTICVKLIQDYHGTISVKSKVDWGTTVTIFLPMEDREIEGVHSISG